jgi:2-oxoglutarate ferredoxin oxidoreductase subunit gamma
MNNRCAIRLTGSGGQGVILISVILAEAAVLNGDKAVQSQAYGPEARGGMCQADTIISNEEIWFSKPEKPDVLLALTQASMNKFSKDTLQTSVIIADSGLSIPGNCPASKIFRIPILETAAKVVGRPMTANIVAAAAINTILDLFPEEIMREAVKMHIPAGTEELNMKAYEEGKKLAERAKMIFTASFITPDRMQEY